MTERKRKRDFFSPLLLVLFSIVVSTAVGTVTLVIAIILCVDLEDPDITLDLAVLSLLGYEPVIRHNNTLM